MQTSNLIPHVVVKQKKSWIPKINGAKIAKFIKDAYFWDEEHERPAEKVKG
jgi:hypothetical protein